METTLAKIIFYEETGSTLAKIIFYEETGSTLAHMITYEEIYKTDPHRVSKITPDRSSETFKEWLKEQPLDDLVGIIVGYDSTFTPRKGRLSNKLYKSVLVNKISIANESTYCMGDKMPIKSARQNRRL